jgi:hypothetical protein
VKISLNIPNHSLGNGITAFFTNIDTLLYFDFDSVYYSQPCMHIFNFSRIPPFNIHGGIEYFHMYNESLEITNLKIYKTN